MTPSAWSQPIQLAESTIATVCARRHVEEAETIYRAGVTINRHDDRINVAWRQRRRWANSRVIRAPSTPVINIAQRAEYVILIADKCRRPFRPATMALLLLWLHGGPRPLAVAVFLEDLPGKTRQGGQGQRLQAELTLVQKGCHQR